MSEATQTAEMAIPAELQTGHVSEVIRDIEEDKGFYTIFFPGNLITLQEKQSESYRLGGRLVLDSWCVKDQYIPRCGLKPLQQGHMPVNAGLVHPDAKTNAGYLKRIKLTNIYNPATNQFETVIIGGIKKMNDHLLFKAVRPKTEVGRLCKNGTVRIDGFKGPKEMMQAQLFYFPVGSELDWVQIIRGNRPLPTRIADLEAWIGERRKDAEPGTQFEKVGAGMLKACQNYRLWAVAYIANQTEQIKDAEKIQGARARYDEIAENLFKECDLTREDGLIQSFAKQQIDSSQTNKTIADAVSIMAKNQEQMQQLFLQNQDFMRSVLARGSDAPTINQVAPAEVVDLNSITPGSMPVAQPVGEVTTATVEDIDADDLANEFLGSFSDAVQVEEVTEEDAALTNDPEAFAEREAAADPERYQGVRNEPKPDNLTTGDSEDED